jgi:hypothetical protein
MNVELKVLGANQTEVIVGSNRLFFSYNTLVAMLYKNGDYYRAEPSTVEKWSQTTSKHVNKWCPSNATVIPYSKLVEIANNG